jgi:hypothetical protein
MSVSDFVQNCKAVRRQAASAVTRSELRRNDSGFSNNYATHSTLGHLLCREEKFAKAGRVRAVWGAMFVQRDVVERSRHFIIPTIQSEEN